MNFTRPIFEKTIEELLQHYECVILPGFGGFIVRESPCNFNAGKDQIRPYAKHIFFNPHLQENDGLIAGEIQKLEQVSYQEAVELCRKSIAELRSEIENSGSGAFGNLGTFYKGQEHIWFAPSPALNLSIQSYGLPSVDVHKVHPETEEVKKTIQKLSPSIKTISTADKLPIETTEPPKTGIRPWLIAASVAALIHFVYLGLENKENTSHQASSLPIPINQVPDTIVEYSETPDAVNTDDTMTLPQNEAVEPSENVQIENTESAEPAVTEEIRDTVVIPSEQFKNSAEFRIARYKLEINAAFHAKDLNKKSAAIRARIEQNGEWYEVIVSEVPIQ